MSEFKSPTSRLVRLFRKSREQWKQRAAEKQKRLRALEVKVRDLRESRDRWKQQARHAQQELHDLQAQLYREPKKGGASL